MSSNCPHMGIFYYQKRYFIFALTTFFVMSLPFVTIDGNQIFLLSFDRKQLHLLGVAFDMQELYLIPFLLMLLFIGIFFITTLGGRVWCGWGCPQTIFRVLYRDVIKIKLLKLRKKVSNKQLKPDMSLPVNKLKKAVAITFWTIISLIASSNLLWYFMPPYDFFAYWSAPKEHTVLLGFLAIMTTVLAFDIVALRENFCIYMCPYSRIQSVLYNNDTIMAVYDYKLGGKVFNLKGIKLWKKPDPPDTECIGCGQCVKVCPTCIDIHKGMWLECIKTALNAPMRAPKS
ncbi:MAG: 4Fe-4S dicluster domain-containing protein [Wolinella sp.]